MTNNFLIVSTVFCLLILATGSAADELTIEKNRQKWQKMSPEEKNRVIEIYRGWKAQPEEKKKMIRRNYETYHELSPQERDILRGRFRTYKQLKPSVKESIREKLQNTDRFTAGGHAEKGKRYRSLKDKSDEEKMNMIERSMFWKSLSNEEKEAFKQLMFVE